MEPKDKKGISKNKMKQMDKKATSKHIMEPNG